VSRSRGRWGVIAGLTILAVALFAAIAEISTQEAADEDPVALEGVREAQRIFGGLRQHRDRVGDPAAPVTMQFFTDLQCGNCAEQFLDTVPALVDELVRTGRAQIHYRHYSFSRNAIQRGFVAAKAAGEQGYQWQYAYIFFASQEEGQRLGVDDEYMDAIAASIPELDRDRWQERLEQGGGEEGEITRELMRQDEIALNLELRAEPSVIVTGPGGTETVQDSPSLDQIRAAVAQVSR